MPNIIAYCDGLIPRSEIGFMRRQYESFDALQPVWVGRRITPEACELTRNALRLGGEGLGGEIDRLLFNLFGRVPNLPDWPAISPRLVHAQFGRGGALALPLARKLGVPLAVTFHGGDANKNKHYERRLIPTVFQRRLETLKSEARLFICVSQSIKARLLSRGFPKEKLVVVHIGIDLPPMQTKDARHALFVGRFVEKKGIAVLISAIRLLRERGVGLPLVLVGDGPLLDASKRQAAGLAGIRFLGWQQNAQVRELMMSAAAVCVPSVTAADGDAEGLPTVAMEAMSTGVPVIATSEAGLGGIIEDGVSGRLVPARDPAGLAKAIEELAGNDSVRRTLGAAGRRVAEARLSAATQSRRLQELFLGLIEGKDPLL